MRAPEVQGIDLFKIAGRSISGWVPSLKTGTVIRQPFFRACHWIAEEKQVVKGEKAHSRPRQFPDVDSDELHFSVSNNWLVKH